MAHNPHTYYTIEIVHFPANGKRDIVFQSDSVEEVTFVFMNTKPIERSEKVRLVENKQWDNNPNDVDRNYLLTWSINTDELGVELVTTSTNLSEYIQGLFSIIQSLKIN